LISRQDMARGDAFEGFDELEYNNNLAYGLMSEQVKVDQCMVNSSIADTASFVSSKRIESPRRDNLSKRLNSFFQGIRQSKVVYSATSPNNCYMNLWSTTPVSRKTRQVMEGLKELKTVSNTGTPSVFAQSPKRTTTLTAESAFQETVKTTIESLKPKHRAAS
jgi:hypothetical protein